MLKNYYYFIDNKKMDRTFRIVSDMSHVVFIYICDLIYLETFLTKYKQTDLLVFSSVDNLSFITR